MSAKNLAYDCTQDGDSLNSTSLSGLRGSGKRKTIPYSLYSLKNRLPLLLTGNQMSPVHRTYTTSADFAENLHIADNEFANFKDHASELS